MSPTLFTTAKTLHQHSHNAQAWLRLQTGHLCWLGSVGAEVTALPSEVAAQNIFTKTATHTLRGLSKVSLAFVCPSELSQAPMHQSSVANHESPPLLTRPGLGVIFFVFVWSTRPSASQAKSPLDAPPWKNRQACHKSPTLFAKHCFLTRTRPANLSATKHVETS